MKRYFITMAITLLLITACSPRLQVNDVDTSSYDIYTQSALTVEAMMTQATLNDASPTPTLEIQAAQTSTQTPAPSATATASATQRPKQTTYCNWVSFVKDVSIPDKSTWIQGTALTKTWRLKNRGSCTWTPDYSLVFSYGSQMGAPSEVSLPGYVIPGETVDISVNLTVPETTGHYVGYWLLKSPSGILFGYGESANKPFYVDLYSSSRSTGSISGKLGFPSEFIPPLRVVAFNLDKGTYFWVDTAQNQQYYKIDGLTTGNYVVVSYVRGADKAGGYSKYVTCGLSVSCHDHSLIQIHIEAGSILSNINPTDWYAPSGTFPPDPTGPTATPTPYKDIPPLTLDGLKNAEYRVAINGAIQTIRVNDGLYQHGTDPTEPGFFTVTLNEPVAFGDLNNDSDDDAAIMLSEWYGGTGINVYVAAVTNWAGIPLHKASALIDDRAIIQSIRIEYGLIIVDAIVHGDDDPGCCPSKHVTRIFRLVGDVLVEQ
ncbi:MAG TPA: NBR1-Ig-like domain-containing protein [Anaerolineales bacterium]|nr:NBR1-Ig-like domain-containing protein [Anaerolineales bacterium]